MSDKVFFQLLFVYLLCPIYRTINGETTFDDKLAMAFSSLSTEIAFLKGELLIKVLPEIERLKRCSCIWPETAREATESPFEDVEKYIQKMDEKVKVFSKAFASEKIRGKAVVGRVENIKEKLDATQRELLELIDGNSRSFQANDNHINEHGKEIAGLKATVNELRDTSRYLSDRVINISQSINSDVSATQKAIQRPSFVSQWFTMKSQDENLSELLIEHGLNKLPIKIDVQIKGISAPQNEWYFSGDSVLQSDDDLNEEYGGVVYFYNETHVLLKTPKKNNNNPSGIFITTGDQSGRYVNSEQYRFSEGLVRVRIWLEEDFPDSTFNSGWLPIDITDAKKTFYEISHGLSDYPAFVSIQIKSSLGWVSEGMGAVMNSPRAWLNAGGVIYGYDDKTVRIWTAYISTTMRSNKQNTFGQVLGTPDGWGTVTKISTNLKGEIKVTAWAPYAFSRGKTLKEFVANVQHSELSSTAVKDIDIETDLLTFSVQALDGPNKGFLFKGFGSSQAQKEPFGGAIFAYNKEGKVKVWRPNENKNGYLIHINQPYGNGTFNQASNTAAYRVSVLGRNAGQI